MSKETREDKGRLEVWALVVGLLHLAVEAPEVMMRVARWLHLAG